MGRSLTTEELDELTYTAYELTCNKLRVASPGEWKHGQEWYINAHERAQALHDDVRVGAEIIAVLSPRIQWPVNLRDAEELVAGKEVGFSAYGTNVSKAWDILLEGKTLAEVTKGGPKSKAFAHNIQSAPADCECSCVTLDTHMMSIFGLHHSILQRKGVYEALSQGVRDAAAAFGLIPMQAQAIAWLTQKEVRRNG